MIEEKAANIRLLILDVDGVLTDGRIVLDAGGEETKTFHVRDGLGLKLLIEAGIGVVIISGRRSHVVEERARNLGIKEIYQGVEDKKGLFIKLIQEKRMKKEQVCCVGDDLPDMPLFNRAGLSIAVADAVPEIREAASFVTKSGGGKGAVREVCEVILKAQKKWREIIAPFLG
ncbi:MAG: HAD-IIIA family hydrolase [Pseudomonadota bacterium]